MLEILEFLLNIVYLCGYTVMRVVLCGGFCKGDTDARRVKWTITKDGIPRAGELIEVRLWFLITEMTSTMGSSLKRMGCKV